MLHKSTPYIDINLDIDSNIRITLNRTPGSYSKKVLNSRDLAPREGEDFTVTGRVRVSLHDKQAMR